MRIHRRHRSDDPTSESELSTPHKRGQQQRGWGPTPGSLSFNLTNGLSEAGGCDNVTAAVPAGKALVVTSLNVTIDSVTTGPVAIVVGAGTSGSPCSVATFLDYSKVPGAPATETVQFPSGLFIKAGHTLDVAILSTSANAAGSASVHGYMVASSLCQSGSATASHTGCW